MFRSIIAFTLATAVVPSVASFADSAPQQKTDTTQVRSYVAPSVTVTTTRAKEDESPIPFSELSRENLRDKYSYQDLPALLADLPSTLFYSENGNAVGYSNLLIRGFDQRRIAVMINGIPQNDPEDHNVYWINFPDLTSSVNSIQVQRGAGLMNYGAPAIGGSVNIQTSDFASERFIRVATGTGIQEYDGVLQNNIQKYLVEISSGLTGNYAFYGRLARIHSAGYRDQSWADLTSFFVSGVRFDEDVTTQINIYGGPINDGLAYNGLPREYITDPSLRRRNYSYWEYDSTGTATGFALQRRGQEVEVFHQPHYQLLNEWRINDNLTLKSALFYITGDGYFDFDGSWADAATLRLTPEYGFEDGVNPGNSIIRAFVGNRQGGFIPRLVWTREDGELTVGLEARLHRSTHWGKIAFAEGLPSGFDPDYKFYEYNGNRRILSLFAREQRYLSEDVTLNLELQAVQHQYAISGEKAGGRYTNYPTTDGGNVGNGDRLFTVNFLFLNPRVGLMARLNEELSLYGSIAFTQREPRMRNLYAASDSYFGARPLFATDTTGGEVRYDFSSPVVKPEKLLNFELGTRYNDGRISFGVNAFWMEFFDELVRSGQLDIFGAPIDGNAPRTRHIGLELEANALLYSAASGFSFAIAGNTTISNNTIVDYSLAQDDGTVLLLNGNNIAGFPNLLANIMLIAKAQDFSATLTFKHVGEFYTDNFNTARNTNPAYSVMNFAAAYDVNNIMSLQKARFVLQVNNLTNNLYSASGVGQEFFPAAERNYYLGIELFL